MKKLFCFALFFLLLVTSLASASIDINPSNVELGKEIEITIDMNNYGSYVYFYDDAENMISSYSLGCEDNLCSKKTTFQYLIDDFDLGNYKIAVYSHDDNKWLFSNFEVVEYRCSDRTLVGECSSTKPKYCGEGEILVDDCSKCGCLDGYNCLDGKCVEREVEEVIFIREPVKISKILDMHSPDANNDGILDLPYRSINLNGDIDGDGIININDRDIDGNGILNAFDVAFSIAKTIGVIAGIPSEVVKKDFRELNNYMSTEGNFISNWYKSDNDNYVENIGNEFKTITNDNFEKLINNIPVKQNSISNGYIVELKSKPLTVENIELEEYAEKNKDSFVARLLSKILPGVIAPTTFENIESKLEGRKENLEREREDFKQGALKELSKTSIITGNAVADSKNDLIVLAEYENVFNGLALDITEEEALEVEKIKGVKSVSPNYFVNITLMDSVPIINADDVWQLDRNGDNCSTSGEECLSGEGITIGVIDTGVDYTHGDLGGCNPFSEIIEGEIEDYSLESPHYYENDYNNIWEITRPGFTEIAVHFDKIDTESKWDTINILNNDNEIVQTISGYHQNFWSDSIKGDTIKIQLVTDANVKNWGFEIDKVINGHVENLIDWSVCDKIVGGYDFVNGDKDPMDDNGHGTHCAATAAGNGVLKGVAPDAEIYAYKVLSSSGSGSWSGVLSAIERAVDPNQDGNFSDHLDIISLSLGSSGGNPDDFISMAVDRAVKAGVVAVIAAGNEGPGEETIDSPGTARKAITVGASNKYDNMASFSSRGPVKWEDYDGNIQYLVKPDIVAPGVDICAAQWEDAFLNYGYSQCLDDEHVSISGTSMATPHVAGAVALLLQKNPDWGPEEIKLSLKNTAVDISPENICDDGIDNEGDGLIDCEDYDCMWEEPCSETICNDGNDGDNDGLIDCKDNDCRWYDACRENICDNGIDDNNNGLIDCEDDDCNQDDACRENICNDGIDNEGDGDTDCEDDDCKYNGACRELYCDDGIDNEGDGLIDCEDNDCRWYDACRENICDNGIDDNNNGLIDCEDDDCMWKEPCRESVCDNGIDGDGDGLIDCEDDDCRWDDACMENICDDGVDDNNNGLIDCEDDDCRWDDACRENICDDGIDNEGDGLTDCEDNDCRYDRACRENICDDGIDNEGDGLTDCEDNDCYRNDACIEKVCDDGIDNDGDELIDCDDDNCMWYEPCRETICDDDNDGDKDGLTDCEDGDCKYNRACMENICDDGIDNEGDGLTDCEDDDCKWYDVCRETVCDDGDDNDKDGDIDCEDGDCKWDNACRENRCDDGIDNDNDGLIDCDDSWNCFNANNCLIQGCEEAAYYGNVDGHLVEGSTIEGPDWWTFDYDGLSEAVTISLCGSDFDTALALLGEDCESLEILGSGDDSDECGHQSVISMKGLDAGKYRIIIFGDENIANFSDESWKGNYKLNISSEKASLGITNFLQINNLKSLMNILKGESKVNGGVETENLEWINLQGQGRLNIKKAIELKSVPKTMEISTSKNLEYVSININIEGKDLEKYILFMQNSGKIINEGTLNSGKNEFSIDYPLEDLNGGINGFELHVLDKDSNVFKDVALINVDNFHISQVGDDSNYLYYSSGDILAEVLVGDYSSFDIYARKFLSGKREEIVYDDWKNIYSSDKNLESGEIAKINVDDLEDGKYMFKISALNNNGLRVESESFDNVIVMKSLKEEGNYLIETPFVEPHSLAIGNFNNEDYVTFSSSEHVSLGGGWYTPIGRIELWKNANEKKIIEETYKDSKEFSLIGNGHIRYSIFNAFSEDYILDISARDGEADKNYRKIGLIDSESQYKFDWPIPLGKYVGGGNLMSFGDKVINLGFYENWSMIDDILSFIKSMEGILQVRSYSGEMLFENRISLWENFPEGEYNSFRFQYSVQNIILFENKNNNYIGLLKFIKSEVDHIIYDNKLMVEIYDLNTGDLISKKEISHSVGTLYGLHFIAFDDGENTKIIVALNIYNESEKAFSTEIILLDGVGSTLNSLILKGESIETNLATLKNNGDSFLVVPTYTKIEDVDKVNIINLETLELDSVFERKMYPEDSAESILRTGDFDNDKVPEILVTTRSRWWQGGPSFIRIYDISGILEKEIMIPTQGEVDYIYDVIIDDKDKDGFTDLIISTSPLEGLGGIIQYSGGKIYVFDLGFSYNKSNLYWTTNRHDYQRTGWDGYDSDACISTDEICDGLDNDCDGKIDEDFTNLGTSCSAGVGECVNKGLFVCSKDGFDTECNAVAKDPIVEVYDGLDNDCDGEIDEGATIGGELDCNLKDKFCVVNDNCCNQEDGCHLFTCGLKDAGEGCFTNDDCSGNLRCNWYKCLDGKSSGSSCFSNNQCSSNNCRWVSTGWWFWQGGFECA